MRDRLVYAEIDLKAFSNNFKNVKKSIRPTCKIMAVVKGNAYGHGLVRIAQKAEEIGVDYLGVACLYEARIIREAGVLLPILLLGYTDSASVEEITSLGISPTVIDSDVAKRLNELAIKHKKVISIHVKIDTGMHRFGLLPSEAIYFIKSLSKYKNLFLEGVFTHFAESDALDPSFTQKQLRVFQGFLNELSVLFLTPPLIHAANSAAILRFRESHFSMVRAGKMLYGPLPMAGISVPFTSQPIISVKTKIVQVKDLKKGDSVGYGRAFVASCDMRIATLPVGYADGFRRAPNTFHEVLVKGKRCKIVGMVSMDQSTIDISNVPDAKVGDEVVLIGKQNEISITVEDVAANLGTISYEVVTSFSERVGREYL